MHCTLYAWFVCFAFISLSCKGQQEIQFKNGDIIFQTSKSAQSEALQLATHSKYSHMGIVYIEGRKTLVFEAIQPVRLTPLSDWIRRGKGSHYVVKRLRDADQKLTSEVIEQMKDLGMQYVGKNYDFYFEWTDERIYCSELVWKLFKQALNIEIGVLQKLRDFDLSHPVVRKRMQERYGDTPPMDELVISPARMFESDLLVTVFSK